jgi:hypothetical protein
MKILTNYTGKGIINILVSFIYMSPSRGTQQNYSAILLFACGIVCIIADYKPSNPKTAFELAIERSKGKRTSINEEPMKSEIKIEIVDNTTKKVDNPYDVLEDF